MFQKSDALFLARAMDPVQRAKHIAMLSSSRRSFFWISIITSLSALVAFGLQSTVSPVLFFTAALNWGSLWGIDERVKMLNLLDAFERARRQPQPMA